MFIHHCSCIMAVKVVLNKLYLTEITGEYIASTAHFCLCFQDRRSYDGNQEPTDSEAHNGSLSPFWVWEAAWDIPTIGLEVTGPG